MDVILHGFGPNSAIESQIDLSHNAGRVSIRPTEVNSPGAQAGGHFSISAMTGVIAAAIASAAPIFQVRWADPTKLFLLKKLTIQCGTKTGFAATDLGAPLELIIGHGSTANGSGGTALAPTGTGNKLRRSMATTGFALAGEIRIATTAALTAATGQSLEPAALAGCMGATNAAASQSPVMQLFEQRDFGVHPLILEASDTLVVRTNTPAATGTWQAMVTMSWAELAVY